MLDSIKYNTIYKINENNIIISTTYEELKKLNIKNWENNRPPDISRVPKIANKIKIEKVVLGIIYIYKDDSENEYYCYDGIHRLKALEYLDNMNYKKVKNKFLIINYINNSDLSLIIKNFKSINSTIPVPELYTTDSRDLNIRKIISDLCLFYQKKYPSHFSPSRRPQIPNQNRDNLFDIFYDLYKECNILQKYNLEQWINLINKYNIYVMDNINLYELSNKQLNKCKLNGCYLFCSKKLYNDISQFIIKYKFT